MSVVAVTRRLVVLTVVAVAGALAASGASAATLAPCSSKAKDHTLCGSVTVPLDRSGALPGTIGLRVRALPPTRGGTSTGTVLALAGGPGQAAVPLLDGFASALAPALRSRQLVTFDQRGTGGSGRIACPSLAREGEAVDAVAGCATDLGPARAHYATADSVADIEAVRQALGVERLILYGTSYGTKVALDYAAAYPQHVERLVLDSVVPPAGVDPFDRTTLASIPRILRTLCVHDCTFTHDPVADLAALVRRLEHAPLRGTVFDSNGRRRSASLTRAGLLGMLLGGDFDRYLRAAFPAAVRATLDGDAAPLLRLSARGDADGIDGSDDSDAVFVATTCEDGGVPWPAGTPLVQRRAAVNAAAAALPASTFALFDPATVRGFGTADLCRSWPESPLAQPQLALPSTPTLILSGDDDLRTPRADATALALRLPGAQLLQVPDSGHGTLFSDPTDCAENGVVAFLDGKIPGRCRSHRPAAATTPLPPLHLASLRPVAGLPSSTGRTVRAVLGTLDDASQQLIAQIAAGEGPPHPYGGLRAGSAAIDPHGLRLRGYAYVPGVVVSGLIASKARHFTLRVSGAAAVRGRLTLSASGIVGTLGGAAVDVSAKALGWRQAKAAAATLDPTGRRAPAPALRLPFPFDS